jgi:transposase-like protein
MARTRRRFSAALKARVALEAIRGQRTAAELAGEHQVHPSQITQGKKQLLDAAQEVFSDHRGQDRQELDFPRTGWREPTA